MNKIKLMLPVLLSLFLMSGNTVNAASCTVTATNINFGTYRFTDLASTEATGDITVDCRTTVFFGRDDADYTIDLSPGMFGNYANREMSANLIYNLYTTTGMTQVWGDATGGTANISGTIPLFRWFFAPVDTGSASHTVHGLIPPGQTDAPAGIQNDTIIVTVTY